MDRKAYTTPVVRRWGTVADLTGHGDSHTFSGSVDRDEKKWDWWKDWDWDWFDFWHW